MKALLPIALLSLCQGCGPFGPPSASLQLVPGVSPPELELAGVTLRFFQGERLAATGRAEGATYRTSTGDGVALKPQVTLKSEESGKETFIDAGRAEGNTRTRRGEVMDRVVLRREDGTTATTARGAFDGLAKTATGRDPVLSEGPGFRSVAAGGFDFDLRSPLTMLFLGPVDTQLDKAAQPAPTKSRRARAKPRPKPGPKEGVAPNRPVSITAKSLEVVPGTRRAIGKGNVRIVRDDVVIECDLLDARYSEQNQLESATCKGNGHLLQRPASPDKPEREAWGDQAVLDNVAGTLVVTGNPRAREGPNLFRGSKVTFLLQDERLLVEEPVLDVESSGPLLPSDKPPPSPGAPPPAPQAPPAPSQPQPQPQFAPNRESEDGERR